MHRRRARSAFSLLELLAVVTILGIIAAIALPRMTYSAAAGKEAACARNKAEINRAIERFYFEEGTWPSGPDDIALMPQFPDGLPICPVTGAPYTFDGATHRVPGHTAGSH